MKLLLSAILAGVVAFNASADDKAAKNDSTGFKFTDVKVVKTTPVKDQNQTGTCWCFSGNSFFEEEEERVEKLRGLGEVVEDNSKLSNRL